MRFTVTAVQGTVDSAVLRIYANTAQTTGYDVYPVANNTWGEATVTDATAPPFGSNRLGSSGKIAAGTWTSVDVTSAVAGNGTYTFGLSTTSSTAVSLSTREGANPPELRIGWASAASVVAPVMPGFPGEWLFLPILLAPVLMLGLLPKSRPARHVLGRPLAEA
jgi:hypothetical protein